MSNEIVKVLDLLAERFGTTVEYLWQVMITQAYISAIYNLVGLLISIGFLFFVIKKTPNWIRKANDNYDVMYTLTLVFSWMFVMVTILYYTIEGIAIIITGIFNPEYLALQKILELLQ